TSYGIEIAPPLVRSEFRGTIPTEGTFNKIFVLEIVPQSAQIGGQAFFPNKSTDIGGNRSSVENGNISEKIRARSTHGIIPVLIGLKNEISRYGMVPEGLVERKIIIEI